MESEIYKVKESILDLLDEYIKRNDSSLADSYSHKVIGKLLWVIGFTSVEFKIYARGIKKYINESNLKVINLDDFFGKFKVDDSDFESTIGEIVTECLGYVAKSKLFKIEPSPRWRNTRQNIVTIFLRHDSVGLADLTNYYIDFFYKKIEEKVKNAHLEILDALNKGLKEGLKVDVEQNSFGLSGCSYDELKEKITGTIKDKFKGIYYKNDLARDMRLINNSLKSKYQFDEASLLEIVLSSDWVDKYIDEMYEKLEDDDNLGTKML